MKTDFGQEFGRFILNGLFRFSFFIFDGNGFSDERMSSLNDWQDLKLLIRMILTE
jgi:hypothetical protein